jgi:hypothetical protein
MWKERCLHIQFLFCESSPVYCESRESDTHNMYIHSQCCIFTAFVSLSIVLSTVWEPEIRDIYTLYVYLQFLFCWTEFCLFEIRDIYILYVYLQFLFCWTEFCLFEIRDIYIHYVYLQFLFCWTEFWLFEIRYIYIHCVYLLS